MKALLRAFAIVHALMAALFAAAALVLIAISARIAWDACADGLGQAAAQGVIEAVGLLAAAAWPNPSAHASQPTRAAIAISTRAAAANSAAIRACTAAKARRRAFMRADAGTAGEAQEGDHPLPACAPAPAGLPHARAAAAWPRGAAAETAQRATVTTCARRPPSTGPGPKRRAIACAACSVASARPERSRASISPRSGVPSQ